MPQTRKKREDCGEREGWAQGGAGTEGAGGDEEEAGSGGAKRKKQEEVTDAEIVP